MRMRFRAASVLAIALALALGCGGKTTRPTDYRVPDFSLPDVNPNSLTHDQMVSPRQFAGKISGFYFGHAT